MWQVAKLSTLEHVMVERALALEWGELLLVLTVA